MKNYNIKDRILRKRRIYLLSESKEAEIHRIDLLSEAQKDHPEGVHESELGKLRAAQRAMNEINLEAPRKKHHPEEIYEETPNEVYPFDQILENEIKNDFCCYKCHKNINLNNLINKRNYIKVCC